MCNKPFTKEFSQTVVPSYGRKKKTVHGKSSNSSVTHCGIVKCKYLLSLAILMILYYS